MRYVARILYFHLKNEIEDYNPIEVQIMRVDYKPKKGTKDITEYYIATNYVEGIESKVELIKEALKKEIEFKFDNPKSLRKEKMNQFSNRFKDKLRCFQEQSIYVPPDTETQKMNSIFLCNKYRIPVDLAALL